jgi:hypothetical protein
MSMRPGGPLARWTLILHSAVSLMMRWGSSMKQQWVVVFASTLALVACQKSAEPPRPSYNIELTNKELMKYAIDPSADIVWAASGYVVDEKGTTDLSPKNREGWLVVENNATIVAELSNALMLPGRSPGESQWDDYSRRLHDAAMATKKAAHDQDRAGLLRTGGDLYAACTACHKYYVLGEK